MPGAVHDSGVAVAMKQDHLRCNVFQHAWLAVRIDRSGRPDLCVLHASDVGNRPLASVTDSEWLASVPDDRPTVAVFDGLSMYRTEQEGQRLIQRITSRFPGGQLLFDVYGRLGIKLQRLVPAIRNAGATLQWGVDDPHEIENLHPGLECLDALRSVDMPGLDKLPLSGRISLAVASRIPKLRDMGRITRFRFCPQRC
jgi:hypothetical protein